MSLAVSIAGYAAQGRKVIAPQKRRVAARGHLTGSNAFEQVVTWQTPNPPGGNLPYAKAHLAVETADARHQIIWQTDGGDTQYLVDSVQLADLDGDGAPEIISLWWEGASAGAALKVFRWDRASRSFTELRGDGLGYAHGYRIKRAGLGGNAVIILTSRADMAARHPRQVEFEARGDRLVRAGASGGAMTQGESGIEGQSFISPTRPGPIRLGDTRPDKQPFETTIAIRSVGEGREVARLKTGSDGRFRVNLPPGEYEVVPAPDKPGRFLPRAAPQQVRVVAGQFAQISIEFDSGMR